MKRLEGETAQAKERLKQARLALQQAREDAFRRVLGGEQVGSGLGSLPPGDMPPGYAAQGYAPPAGPPPGYSS
jgi:hypothetical protein